MPVSVEAKIPVARGLLIQGLLILAGVTCLAAGTRPARSELALDINQSDTIDFGMSETYEGKSELEANHTVTFDFPEWAETGQMVTYNGKKAEVVGTRTKKLIKLKISGRVKEVMFNKKVKPLKSSGGRIYRDSTMSVQQRIFCEVCLERITSCVVDGRGYVPPNSILNPMMPPPYRNLDKLNADRNVECDPPERVEWTRGDSFKVSDVVEKLPRGCPKPRRLPVIQGRVNDARHCCGVARMRSPDNYPSCSAFVNQNFDELVPEEAPHNVTCTEETLYIFKD